MNASNPAISRADTLNVPVEPSANENVSDFTFALSVISISKARFNADVKADFPKAYEANVELFVSNVPPLASLVKLPNVEELPSLAVNTAPFSNSTLP